MPLIVRLGDTSSHGGNVITSASATYAEGPLVARKGDMFNCPIDGINPIATGSGDHTTEGKPTARHGDVTACGASLISAASETFVD